MANPKLLSFTTCSSISLTIYNSSLTIKIRKHILLFLLTQILVKLNHSYRKPKTFILHYILPHLINHLQLSIDHYLIALRFQKRDKGLF